MSPSRLFPSILPPLNLKPLRDTFMKAMTLSARQQLHLETVRRIAKAQAHMAKYGDTRLAISAEAVLSKAVHRRLCSHPPGPTFVFTNLVNSRVHLRCEFCGASIVLTLE